ncbi:hypothetical protein PRIPAC_97168 [Pristionchus pacificus]|nr:hypothetical protein PRIPAC_97168 [Pristionchus pacificus]
MRLILVLALVSFASANIFGDAFHTVKHWVGIEDSDEVESIPAPVDEPAVEVDATAPKESDIDMTALPQMREKRGCGCSHACGCKHTDVDTKYLPLFFKLHRGECGCKTRKPCGCPARRPCGCRPHYPPPRRPCHGGGCEHHGHHDDDHYGGHGYDHGDGDHGYDYNK